jgi:Xaa-Pro aminopeptidase
MIKPEEYTRRRRNLMQQMGRSSIAIVPGADEQIRSRDTHFRFRQDSNLEYLSGFPEPESVLVLIPGRAQGQVILFCREKDRTKEIWDGYRAGPEGAIASYGADDAFPISDMDEILPGLIENKEKVFYSMGLYPELDKHLTGWINHIRAQSRSGMNPPGEIVDLNHLVHEMRLIKSATELKVMRKSAKISADAHTRAMQLCKPGMHEYQLQAEIEYYFALQGAEAPAYNTIVGGGTNACVLHYIENRAPLRDGDLVLIDAGSEYLGYAADITRTFPVGGRFSAEQRALYEIALAAQYAAIDACQIGRRFIEPHEISVRVICQGLIDLGLLSGALDEVIEKREYARFYMHRVGHWLGMDVHDVGDYKVDGANGEWREFEAGMVTTVEPGIYVHPDDTSVDARWRGIGIRIEDDIAIRKDGPEILTEAVVKTPDDIEALMRG